MSPQAQVTFEVRKTPVQARSAVTVEAIGEATIQVLLSLGADRLTTTRVAERAGVSVGTLYQYFPNKRALLFAAMEGHLTRLMRTMEKVCAEQHHQPIEAMAEAVATAFITAKMERPDVSMALYAVSSELNGVEVMRRVGRNGRAAMAKMLASAPDASFEDVEFTTFMLYAVMAGATRAVLEGGAAPKMVRSLRKELVVICKSYLAASAMQG
ncbi:TetR/AcrR family transcriptional regulator [Granulicella sibirica]|uniref:Transcriptional regulator, TetR family n=1 Tax=Granulicella sibirica TaxID=2479048 RepID=A0A4Q0T6D6_9BACT|nr:TetR/AcrR family transcriptional regulator [Granulicella sibirica]RXH57569.1 Transcriptional regulator, TetR family [Granulicella sibirica]